MRPITIAAFDETKIGDRSALPERPIVLCPAQFSTDKDYLPLIADLNRRGHPVFPVKLTWLDWISIVKSAFTSEYWSSTLPLNPALDFYTSSVAREVSKIDGDYSILAHSIGGWVSRGYLSDAPPSVSGRCRSVVTLGTPHNPPPKGSVVSNFDQTRGLLEDVNKRKNVQGTKYVAVVSRRVKGGFKGIDEVLAMASYFALRGKGPDVEGDGITDVESGELEGGTKIVLDDACHLNFLPSPLPFGNLRLNGARWYGDFLDEWIDELR